VGVINISQVSEEVFLAKKAPKKNNDARQHPSPCLSSLAKKNASPSKSLTIEGMRYWW